MSWEWYFKGIMRDLLAFPILLAMVFPNKRLEAFEFMVSCDMRVYGNSATYPSSDYFRGACERMAALGAGVFMLTPGDADYLADTHSTIEDILGTGYDWIPVVGNHELPGQGSEPTYGANIQYLRDYVIPVTFEPGPAGSENTTFSFDYENVHFIVLNQYFDHGSDIGTNGDVADSLYQWLVEDLEANAQPIILVFGHEPAYPLPDADSGRLRHVGDSLDEHPENRDRFWALLRERGVLAYICGHTHNFSAQCIDGVWQVDAGHAREVGDTGAPSTFVRFEISDHRVKFSAFRETFDGDNDYADIIHRYESTVLVDGRMFLEGAYDIVGDTMRTVLRKNDVIPLTAPYFEDPRTVAEIPRDVTDWVLVQLRKTADGSVVASRSCFVRSDGILVSEDGTRGVSLDAVQGN